METANEMARKISASEIGGEDVKPGPVTFEVMGSRSGEGIAGVDAPDG